MANPSFDTILSTTLKNYRDELTDNVFKATPLLWYLTKTKKPRMLSGGQEIVEPIIHTVGQSGSYSGYDAITITPQETATAANFNWRQLFATVAISGLEELQNSGEEAVINLLDAKVMQAEETLKNGLNLMLYGDGTGNSNKDWLGLSALVGDATIGPAVVGGITVATDAYWRSKVTDAGTAVPLTLKLMGTSFNNASKGNDTPDALFTTQALYESYEALLQPNMRYEDKASANAGFQSLTFKGKPIYWDVDCTTGTIYFLNSKYLALVGHKDRWFKQSPFTQPLSAVGGGTGTTVDARYSIITTAGNFTVRNRARHARLYDVV